MSPYGVRIEIVLDTVREVDLRFATGQTGNGVKLNEVDEHIQPKWSTSCGCWRPLRHSVNITGNTAHKATTIGFEKDMDGY